MTTLAPYPPDRYTIADATTPTGFRVRLNGVTADCFVGPVAASADSRRMLTTPADAYEKTVASAVDDLVAKSQIQKSDVTLATVFTTGSVTGSLGNMAKRARAQPVPMQVDPWTVETPLDKDNHIRFRATFQTPEYRDATTQKWHVKNAGAPDEQGTAVIEMVLAFS